MSTVKICDICQVKITSNCLHPSHVLVLHPTRMQPEWTIDCYWQCWQEISGNIRDMIHEKNAERVRLLSAKPPEAKSPEPHPEEPKAKITPRPMTKRSIAEILSMARGE